MNRIKDLGNFLQSKETQKGQTLVQWALTLVFVILPILALSVDFTNALRERRQRKKIADAACLNGAIAMQLGMDPYTKITSTIADHGLTSDYYTPQTGTGENLTIGIEIAGNEIRVALWGPSQSWFSHFIPGWNGWEMGARSICDKGLGGPSPLVLEEFPNDGDDVLETNRPNDSWEGGICPDQVSTPDSDPSLRDPAYCWVWGHDQQILAGDGHNPNEGTTSMNGLIAPDVRCEGAPGESNQCENTVFIPPAEEGAVNPLKNQTMDYMCGGYNGYEPIPGNYTGVHSANIVQLDGVSNHMLVQEITSCYSLGELLVFWVYEGGQVWDGHPNRSYVEVIGLAVGRITYIDANTIAVLPVYPEQNLGDPTTLRDDLPKTIDELAAAGFNVDPILLPWN